MRWWILGLLFFSTTINYLDRTILAVLLPVIRDDFHIDESAYGAITAAFQVAYMMGALVGGKLIDRFGTQIGLSVSAGIWSLAAVLHGSVTSPMQFGIWRAVLGFAEAANFPAANKAASEWFNAERRGFVVGVYTAGTNIAAVIGPPLFIATQQMFGWRVCFALIGGLGLVWTAIWFFSDRESLKSSGSPMLSKTRQVPLSEVVRYPAAWGFAIAKFFTDPVWWFLLFWLPLYFHDVRGFEMRQLAWALPFIYLMATFGAIAGGWFSGYLMRRGWHKGRARKTTMLIAALLMPVSGLGMIVQDSTQAIVLFSLATVAHNIWMANLFTTTTDVFPKEAVAQASGLGGLLGGFGGTLFSAVIPGAVIAVIGYTPLFVVMSLFYLVALGFVHWLMGDLEQVEVRSVSQSAVELA
jgi:ACS family hexuronate transporter-like MFS transporter